MPGNGGAQDINIAFTTALREIIRAEVLEALKERPNAGVVERDYITVAEAASTFHIGKRRLRRRVPTFRIGRRTMVRRNDVLRLIEETERPPGDALTHEHSDEDAALLAGSGLVPRT